MKSNQRGAVLITCLVFLVVLTMLAITTSRMSSLEERMSGNMRDRSIAMQAAEMAMRDAEKDILGSKMNGATPRCPNNLNGLTETIASLGPALYSDCNSSGLYNGLTGTAPSVAYGTFTGASALPTALSAQPLYMIEGFPPGGGNVPPPAGDSAVGPGGGVWYYRITASAQGVNANTVVWLQEVFKPN